MKDNWNMTQTLGYIYSFLSNWAQWFIFFHLGLFYHNVSFARGGAQRGVDTNKNLVDNWK